MMLMRSRAVRRICSSLLLTLLVACSEEGAQVAQNVASSAPPPKKVEATTDATPAEPPPKYRYQVNGRRDPFEPLLAISQQPVPGTPTEPQTPLQSFDLGQLRLVAVIIGKGPSSAMVLAPDGKGYILKKGVRVGKYNGQVTGIRADAVVVEEQFIDFSGEVKKRSQEIQLPKREGA